MNIGLVDENFTPLKGIQGRSFRIRHFQQPMTPSSNRSIDDVICGSHQMLSGMETVLDCQNFKRLYLRNGASEQHTGYRQYYSVNWIAWYDDL